MFMKKLMIIVPHLSTGGLPQYVAKQIEMSCGEYEIWCVEWDSITGGVLVVQRNKIQNLIGTGLVTLGEDKYEFLRLLDDVCPDIIHFQEIPETFIQRTILDDVYKDDRHWQILVTTHSSYTEPSNISYGADRFVLVSDWSRRRFASVYGDDRCSIWEYPVEKKVFDKISAKKKLGFELDKVHFLHVGLFTPGKNQKLIVDAVKSLQSMDNIRVHFVGNQAENFRDYWEPIMSDFPLNCTWHGERHNVDDFYKAADVFLFPSLFELNPLSLKEASGFGLPIALNKLETYDGVWDNCVDLHMDPEGASRVMCEMVESVSGFFDGTLYGESTKMTDIVRRLDPLISINFINGPYVEVNNAPGEEFDLTITDRKSGFVVYGTTIGNGCWARANLMYVRDWRIRLVRKSDGKEFIRDFDPNGKRVFISLESRSIGDTLAWFPQVEEFRKKHDCKLVCSTFWNEQLSGQYPEIEFVSPGSVVDNIYAMFSIGWFFDGDSYCPRRHPRDFKNLPLGQTAADILNIEYKQERARLDVSNVIKSRKVGLGIHSTAQTKYWNNPTGWQDVTNFLTKIGYEVIILSNEGDGYMGNNYPSGASVLPSGSFDRLKEEMASCELFIGIGSGLSWLSWTLGVPTVLISGFSRPESEFEGDGVLRIFNESSCNGCYNRYKFNAGDWNWCPDHAGTERQFECTKSITGRHVIARMIEEGFVHI